ncbi:hypothetical protein Agub_g6718, partial [Astrephomene gubernaculifera]
MLLQPLTSLCQTPLGGVVLAFVVIITWLGSYPFQRWRLRRFPGPFGLPFLGNLPEIASMDMTAYLQHVARKYGPVCKIWVGSRPWVVISDPDLVRKLAYQCTARPSDGSSYLHVMTGEIRDIDQAGILMVKGEAWRRARRVFEASIVHPASLASHLPSVSRCLARFLPLLERHAAGAAGGGRSDPWDACGQLGNLMLAMVGEIAYGVDFGALPADETPNGYTNRSNSITDSFPSSSAGSALASACKATFDTMRLENASAYLPLQLALPALQPLIRAAARLLPDRRQRRAMAARSAVAATSRHLMRAWQQQREKE